MARKVFMSFLGTGLYQPCCYQKDDFCSEEVNYIQEATIQYLNSKNPWTGNDACYILLTDGAENVHWGATKMQKNRNSGEWEFSHHEGLSLRLEKLGMPFSVFRVGKLPEGGLEDDIMEIFKRMKNLICDGDELYLDITHAFRYLPMLMVVFSNYVSFTKDVNIKSITYGNWDARTEIEKDGRKVCYAPIVDLLPLVSIQEWTYAAGQFLESGDVTLLNKLADSAARSLAKEAQGKDTNVTALRGYIKNLSKAADEWRYCRGRSIVEAKTIKELNKSRDGLNAEVMPLIEPIFAKLQSQLDKFNGQEDVLNGLAAARWCYDHCLIQQAATILEEFIVTLICKNNHIPWIAEDDRGIVTKAFSVEGHEEKDWWLGLPNDATEAEIEERIRLIKSIRDTQLFKELQPIYNDISSLRNDLNHAGMRKNPASVKTILESVDDYLTRVEKVIEGNKDIVVSHNTNSLFINLSNHPSADWLPEQMEAAQHYGAVVDLPFPNISPYDDEACIAHLADEYVQRVRSLAQDNDVVVHLMGEMNLTYALVSRLLSLGITCLASTTERNTVNLPNGEKKSTFRFVRFRRYE